VHGRLEASKMKAKLIIFPSDDGFQVVVWAAWTEGSIRTRSFDNRTELIALLENLRFIGPTEARELEEFPFLSSCPLFSAEIDEAILETHGFQRA
jgi:hypothetical protein